MRVGIALYTLSGFPQDSLRGVAAYARPHRPWTFDYGNQSLDGVEGLLLQKPDGILISSNDPKVLDLVARSKVPAVNMHYARTPPGIGHLSNDDTAVGQMAAAHFINRGYTRFAYFHRTADEQVARLSGFEAGLAQAGHTCHVFDVPREGGKDSNKERHERELATWLRSLPRPVGLFCLGDHYAWIIAERCTRLGIQVPNEIAILGVDNDITLCALAATPLSSVQTGHERMGYEAARLLDEMMNRKRPRKLAFKIAPIRVVERRSTDALAASDKIVAAALRHMQTHLADTQGMVVLSEQLHCARRSLERRFHTSTGLSPAEAWRRLRVEEARRLLADTPLPIAEVALKSGFTDSKHLALAFKKTTGQTPGGFRRHASPK